MQCLNMMNSVTMFRCITCDKTIICNHQGKKDVTDHIDTPNQKSKAEVRKNQTQITFLSECDNTILQKLTFAELKQQFCWLLTTFHQPFTILSPQTLAKYFLIQKWP